MYRTTTIIAGVLFGVVPCVLGQQRANPETPEDAFSSRQLIAWSQVQKPQPAPQPLPPRDTPIPQPEQPQDEQSKPPADSQTEREPVRSFTGKIVREGGKYVLKADNTVYRLEGQLGFQKYENQPVKVQGTLDDSTNTITVVRIEVIS
jgi:hypothetical protein